MFNIKTNYGKNCSIIFKEIYKTFHRNFEKILQNLFKHIRKFEKYWNNFYNISRIILKQNSKQDFD